MRDLSKVEEDGYIYRQECSKTQQAGVAVDSSPHKPIFGRSADAFAAWLKVTQNDEWSIFRRVWKGRVGPALLLGQWRRSSSVGRKLAGLEGDFGTHSLRSSGERYLPAVMTMTEYRSVASVVDYFPLDALSLHAWNSLFLHGPVTRGPPARSTNDCADRAHRWSLPPLQALELPKA